MIIIDRIPKKLNRFFKGFKRQFSARAFFHFWTFIVYLSAGLGKPKLQWAAQSRRPSRHRTRLGAFLKESHWDEVKILDQAAWNVLQAMRPRRGETMYLIIDETKQSKWAKVMAAVGTMFHHVLKRFVQGHVTLVAAVSFRGITVPWRISLYAKKEYCQKVKGTGEEVPFRTLTDLAVEAIDAFNVPKGIRVVALFDCFYLCSKVVKACQRRGWTFISVGKSNRNLTVNGTRRKLGRYAQNVIRRSGRGVRLGNERFRIAERIGALRGIGPVKCVFSRRGGDRNIVSLVTNDLRLKGRTILVMYSERWHIEVLVKQLKQHLGWGGYQMISYRGVVRHLHLVSLSSILLTHLGITALGAQAKKPNTVLWLPSVTVLQSHLRRLLYEDVIKRVIHTAKDKKVIRKLEYYLNVA